ncbi:FmdB family zinc ribbon protein [Aeromicrobium sp.]|uniref:FmdB family zinc ribbon protein n=1 Tax=Aeromicrobium sp. TaxID=1871063 RepID=UPI0010DB0E15|nr:MAG: FmdB family transcriptional regulator [Actinomycetales bacterium]
MPTYQYQCTDCGEALEVHQSFTDDALTECPACQGRLRKVFNAVGVVFKGSGFYRNDSRGTTTSSETSSSSSASASKDSGGAKEKTSTSSATSGSSTSSSSTSSGGSAS